MMNQQIWRQQLNNIYNKICTNFNLSKYQLETQITQAEKQSIKLEQLVSTAIKNKEQSLKGYHPEYFEKYELKLAKKSSKLQKIRNKINKIKQIQIVFVDLFEKLLCLCLFLIEQIDFVQKIIQIQNEQVIVCFEGLINCIKDVSEQNLAHLPEIFIKNYKIVLEFFSQNNIVLDQNKFEEQLRQFDQIRKIITKERNEVKKQKKQKNKEVQNYVLKKQKQQKRERFDGQSEEEIESSESQEDSFIQNEVENQEQGLRINSEEVHQINQENEALSQNQEEEHVEYSNESIIIFELGKLNLKQQEDEIVNYQKIDLDDQLQQVLQKSQEEKELKSYFRKKYQNAKLKLSQSQRTAKRNNQNKQYIGKQLIQQQLDFQQSKDRIQQFSQVYKNQVYEENRRKIKQNRKQRSLERIRQKDKKIQKYQDKQIQEYQDKQIQEKLNTQNQNLHIQYGEIEEADRLYLSIHFGLIKNQIQNNEIKNLNLAPDVQKDCQNREQVIDYN